MGRLLAVIVLVADSIKIDTTDIVNKVKTNIKIKRNGKVVLKNSMTDRQNVSLIKIDAEHYQPKSIEVINRLNRDAKQKTKTQVKNFTSTEKVEISNLESKIESSATSTRSLLSLLILISI